MEKRKDILGPFELVVLLGLMRCGSGSGMQVFRTLTESKVSVSLGAVYTTMDRLEKKNLLVSTLTGSQPRRGARQQRVYCFTRQGIRVTRFNYCLIRDLGEGIKNDCVGL